MRKTKYLFENFANISLDLIWTDTLFSTSEEFSKDSNSWIGQIDSVLIRCYIFHKSADKSIVCAMLNEEYLQCADP